MYFQANLLPVGCAELPQFVERPADLLDCFLIGYAFGQIVGLDLDARAAAIVGQLDVLFCPLDLLLQPILIGVVEGEVRPGPHQRDGAVGETLPDRAPLDLAQVSLHAMRVLRPQFNAQDAGPFAVRDQRREVPILAPEVCHQPEFHLGAAGVRPHEDLAEWASGHGPCAQRDRTLEKLPACAVNYAHAAVLPKICP